LGKRFEFPTTCEEVWDPEGKQMMVICAVKQPYTKEPLGKILFYEDGTVVQKLQSPGKVKPALDRGGKDEYVDNFKPVPDDVREEGVEPMEEE